MNEIIYIYGLYCPISQQVRYVGKSIQPVMRLQQHLSEGYYSTDAKKAWMRELREANKSPELVILQIIDDPDADDREIEIDWMYHLFDEGCDLVNHLPRRVSEKRAEERRQQQVLDKAINRGRELFGDTP